MSVENGAEFPAVILSAERIADQHPNVYPQVLAAELLDGDTPQMVEDGAIGYAQGPSYLAMLEKLDEQQAISEGLKEK